MAAASAGAALSPYIVVHTSSAVVYVADSTDIVDWPDSDALRASAMAPAVSLSSSRGVVVVVGGIVVIDKASAGVESCHLANVARSGTTARPIVTPTYLSRDPQPPEISPGNSHL